MSNTFPADHVPVIVTCSKPISSRLQQLRDAGLQIEHTMDSIGIVTGSIPRDRYDELTRVPDTVVETSAEVTIPPPDAPIQ